MIDSVGSLDGVGVLFTGSSWPSGLPQVSVLLVAVGCWLAGRSVRQVGQLVL
jgi:hypothetical protein